MLRPLALLIVLLSLPLPAAAQYWATVDHCLIDEPKVHPEAFGEDRAFIEAVAAREINGVGRLWKITAPNGAQSHLWGTFHSNDPTILKLPAELRGVLASASVVATEYNPIPPTRRAMEAARQDERIWRPIHSTYRFSLPNPEVEQWISSRLDALGFSRNAAHALTDLGLIEALLADPCNDFLYGIFPIQDDRLLLLGADAGARIAGLEPADAFRDTLSRQDRAETARALIEVYGAYLNPAATRTDRATTYALYLRGEIAMMRARDTAYLISIYGDARAAELLALAEGYLVNERNLTFLETAKPMLDAGSAVLGVGSFHLPGEAGMIELLRGAGYTVERVVTENEIP